MKQEGKSGKRHTKYSTNTRPSQCFHYIGLILLHISAYEQSHNQAKTNSTFNMWNTLSVLQRLC